MENPAIDISFTIMTACSAEVDAALSGFGLRIVRE
jgi:hypothetical protein